LLALRSVAHGDIVTSLLPNPDELAEQLDHVRATQGYLDEVAAWLQQGITLFGRANGAASLAPPAPAAPELVAPEPEPEVNQEPEQLDAGAPEPEPEPVAPEVAEPEDADEVAPAPAVAQVRSAGAVPAKLDDRDFTAKILSALISSNQPLSRAQIADLSGLTVQQITNPLRAAVNAGKVIATGATVSRRYTAAQALPHSEQSAKVKAGTTRNAVKMTTAVQKIGLREKVMRAVRSKPGQLTIADLARHLKAVEEDVVEAVAHHVEREQLTCASDGTYTAAALRAASPVRS
jgi:DNA-binding Lrp family transcriptional regulator